MRHALFVIALGTLAFVLAPLDVLAVDSCTAGDGRCCVCQPTGPNCYNCKSVPSSQGGFTQCGEPGPCACISTDIPCGSFASTFKPAGPWGLWTRSLIPDECVDFKPLGGLAIQTAESTAEITAR